MKISVIQCGCFFSLLIMLLSGCVKEEVTNTPIVSVKMNGQPVNASLTKSTVIRYYKIDPETNDSTFSHLITYFILSVGDKYLHVALQTNSPNIYRGKYVDDFRAVNFCYFRYGSGLQNLDDEMGVIQHYDENISRMWLTFSGTWYENNNAVNISGELLGVSYISEKTDTH